MHNRVAVVYNDNRTSSTQKNVGWGTHAVAAAAAAVCDGVMRWTGMMA